MNCKDNNNMASNFRSRTSAQLLRFLYNKIIKQIKNTSIKPSKVLQFLFNITLYRQKNQGI